MCDSNDLYKFIKHDKKKWIFYLNVKGLVFFNQYIIFILTILCLLI